MLFDFARLRRGRTGDAAVEKPELVAADSSRGVRHYAYVDALRGAAFLLVFALHLGQALNIGPSFLGDIAARGFAGVQLFYVLSAYTLCLSLNDRAGEASPVRSFFLRRLFRIAPMYWVAILLYLAVYGATPRWGAPEGVTASDVWLNVFFLHGVSPEALNGVVPGGWSVAVEMQFYLLLPILFAVSASLTGLGLLSIGSLVVCAFGTPLLENAAIAWFPADSSGLIHEFAYFSLVSQLPVFMCGIALFRLERLRAPPLAAAFAIKIRDNARLLSIVIVCVVTALAFPVAPGVWPPRLAPGVPGHIGYGFLFALLVFAQAMIDNRVTRYFGKVSFSAYLLHPLCIHFALHWPGPQADPLIFTSLALGSTLILASIGYAVVETPGLVTGKFVVGTLAAKDCGGGDASRA